jgi:hypothetical protein
MNEVLTFVLQMREMMSGGLAKLATTAHSTFAGIDKHIATSQNHFASAGRSVNDLNNRLALLTQKRDLSIGTSDIARANREIEQMEQKIAHMQNMGRRGGGGGNGGNGFWNMARGSFVGGMAVSGAMMAGHEIVNTGKEAFSNGVELGNMKVGLETFVGKRANEIVEGVLKQAFYTPFTTSALLPIEMGFIATGMTPERSNRDMMNLANAVAATGGTSETLNRIGADMMGAAAKGSIQGRELMELQRTGHINIQSLIAKDLFPKLPMEQGLAKVEDMDISWKVFENALQRASDKGGMFAGALDRLSQTIGGKNSTIKDMWWNMTAKLTESQASPIMQIQDGLIKGLDNIPEILAKVGPVLNTLFTRFNDVMPSIKNFGKGLWDLAKPIGGLLLSKQFADLAKGAFDLASEMSSVLKPIVTDVAHAIRDLLPLVTGLVHDLSGMVGGIGALVGLVNQVITGRYEKPVEKPSYAAEKSTVPLQPGFSIAPAPVDDMSALVREKTDKGFGAYKGNDKDINDLLHPAKPAETDANAITGGGRKQIIIHAKFAEHFDVHAATLQDAAKESKEFFMRCFLEVLQSANSAM